MGVVKKRISNSIHYIRSLNYSKFIDVGIVFLGLALVLFGSFSLYNFDTVIDQGGGASAIAVVKRAKLSPKRKINGSLNWNKIIKGQDLYRGDYVVTDDLSEVDVTFDNNSSLKIPSNSLVKIDYVGNSIHLELVKGLVNLDLRNMKSKVFVKKDGKNYQLEAENGRVEVRDNGKKLEFSSDKGKVKVSEVKGDGSKLKPIKVSKKIINFEYPEGRIIDPLKSNSILVKVKGADKKSNYELSIFDNSGVKVKTYRLDGKKLLEGFRYTHHAAGDHRIKLINKEVTKESSFVIKQLPKIMISRDSSLDKRIVNAGTRVKFSWSEIKSQTYIAEIKQNGKVYTKNLKRPFFTVYPKSNSTVNYRLKLDHKLAKWTSWKKQSLEINSAYQKDNLITKEKIFLDAKDPRERKVAVSGRVREDVYFEFAHDENFKKVIYKFKRKNKNYVVVPRSARPGKYFWRMREVNKSIRKSSAYPLTLYSYAVRLSSKNVTRYKVQKTKGKRVSIKWKERIKGSKYKIVLKNSKGEELPKLDKVIKGNKITLKMPSFGRYQFYLKAVSNNNVLIPTKPFSLNIEKESVEIDFAVKDVLLKRTRRLGLSKHIMELPKLSNKDHKKLHVYIYRDKDAKRIVHRDATSRDKIIWRTNRSGEYYYRLRVENQKGLLSDFSPKKKVLFPISPFFVTNVRVPAGKQRYYKFPYIIKKGDNLATILRNYTNPNTVLSNKSPMVQLIIKKNTHIKNWSKLQKGRKINIFVSVDSLDKSFLYIYKNLFVVKG